MGFHLLQQIRIGIRLMIAMILLTGLVYPMIVTGIAHILFPWQANGSLIELRGMVAGSKLIGQLFTAPEYFWGRPSATFPFPYNAAYSRGSNLGPLNPKLIAIVKKRVQQLHSFDPGNNGLVPVDLVTASASGLDPDISPLSAYYQAHRIALARNLPESTVHQLIARNVRGRTFGVLGEPRVNVLELNLALDKLHAL